MAKIALPEQQLNEVDQREQLCSISNAASLCGLGDVNDSLQYLSHINPLLITGQQVGLVSPRHKLLGLFC